MRAQIITAAAVLTVLLAFAPNASAQSAVLGGARVERFDECTDYVDYVICSEGQVVTNYIETPNDRRMGVSHFDVEVTIWGTETYPCDYEGRWTDHTQSVFEVDGSGLPTYQQEHYIRRDEVSFGCEGGPTTTCVSYALLHEIDNDLTFWRYETICTEEPV